MISLIKTWSYLHSRKAEGKTLEDMIKELDLEVEKNLKKVKKDKKYV